MVTDLIRNESAGIEEELLGWRRHLHRYPELSFKEVETSAFIIKALKEMGYQHVKKIGETGVCAVLDTGRPGPCTAFRADMDALPITEDTGLSFASENSGIMHACGHDAHMAVLLGTAKLLLSLKENLNGIIKFIFQPGEEGYGGAKKMIEAGVLKDPGVASIFALHVIPELPSGTIGTRKEYLTATDDSFLIKVYGKAAHSSEPQNGLNAVVIAAQIVTALQTILSCNTGPFDEATMSVCTIHGGEAENIIPAQVEMKGMIRCIKKDRKLDIRKRMESIVRNTAQALGADAEIIFNEGYPSVYNDPELTELVIDAGKSLLDEPENLFIIERPHMGSEDFSYYQEVIPGSIFMLGCGIPGEDRGALHTPNLDIDEKALIFGVRIFSKIAFSLNGMNDLIPGDNINTGNFQA